MNTSPHLIIEQEHQRAFEDYWKSRGITVETKIEQLAMRHFTAFNLRSTLIMRVPSTRHQRVYGVDKMEIKNRGNRKWLLPERTS